MESIALFLAGFVVALFLAWLYIRQMRQSAVEVARAQIMGDRQLLEARMKSSAEELTSRQEECLQLRDQIVALKEQQAGTQAQLQAKQEEIVRLQMEGQERQQKLDALNHALASSDQHVLAEKLAVAEKNGHDRQAALSALQEEYTQLRDRSVEQQALIKSREEQLQQLQSDAQSSRTEITTQQKECAQLREQVTKLKEQQAATQAQLQAQQTDISRLESDVKTRQQKVEELRQTLANSDQQVLTEKLAVAEKTLREEQTALQSLQTQYRQLRDQSVEQQALLQSREEQLQRLQEFTTTAQAQLSGLLKQTAAEALQANSQQFFEQALQRFETLKLENEAALQLKEQAVTQLVTPINQQLEALQQQVQKLDKERVRSTESLATQLQVIQKSEQSLIEETRRLAQALQAPQVRGRWGELQLQRVVEVAGMVDHCDFLTQVSVGTDAGRQQPDMVVNLPNSRQIIVDAKVPLKGYLQALDTQDPSQRSQGLKDHARQVRNHITALGSKKYWEQFSDAPEFVVMFIPGEVFFSAALTEDPELIEVGASSKVILATPTTLIALLKAVAYGWQHRALEENARKIQDEGQKLYRSLVKVAEHFQSLGKSLNKSVEAYNSAVGSLEKRLLPSARRLQELMPTDVELKEPVLGEKVARQLQAPELLEEIDSDD